MSKLVIKEEVLMTDTSLQFYRNLTFVAFSCYYLIFTDLDIKASNIIPT